MVLVPPGIVIPNAAVMKRILRIVAKMIGAVFLLIILGLGLLAVILGK